MSTRSKPFWEGRLPGHGLSLTGKNLFCNSDACSGKESAG